LKAETIVRLSDATLRLQDRWLLAGTSWRVNRGEHWAVLGPNGAGKTTLVRCLAGEIPVVQGEIHPAAPELLRRQAARVSFEQQRGFSVRSEQEDEYRHFSGKAGGGLRVGELLRLPAGAPRGAAGNVPAALQVEDLLERRVLELSSGELRRFQIALALAAATPLLILDEPFEGLDPSFREALARIIGALMTPERAVVLVAHRRHEILPEITHVLGVKDGRVVFQGPREDALSRERLEALFAPPPAAGARPPLPAKGLKIPEPAGALIELRDVTVAYGGRVVFKNLNWTVRPGEHWAISGPNGSGKTTLLRLIAGEHPQAYANRVSVFGKRRGEGESLAELRARIGIVSPELQVRYRKRVTAFETVVSGFFGSVGLYRRPSPQQADTAARWMECFGIASLSGRFFDHLSHGEQRLALLARAMVKSPPLLILDEPCQGLDRLQRRLILATVDQIVAAGSTTILYVSHHAGEVPAAITHRLTLERSGSGPTRASGAAVQNRLT
jgi:molybdate transport system ATP-binding protein